MTGVPAPEGKTRSLHSALVFAACLWFAGCADTHGFFNTAKVPPFRDQKMTLEDASNAITAGTATKADVIAALGAATIVRFDSGFEVWVYPARSRAAAAASAGAAEFVILFAPSGIVKKTRIRPSYE
jgi:hypothetical protein